MLSSCGRFLHQEQSGRESTHAMCDHQRSLSLFLPLCEQVHVLVLDKMVRLQILDNLSIVKWAVAPSNSEQFTT